MVQRLNEAMDVSADATNAQLDALFGRGCARQVEFAGALTLAEGRCNGRPVRVALTDRAIRGGSFGVEECNALARHIARSSEDAIPMVLVLDSGGARLDAGLAGLGAFRRLYRTAVDLRLQGVAMSALILRNCFGGASMLAMLCATRGALRRARMGMSGPGIIEALAGKTDLDASDAAEVDALFGSSARADSSAIDLVFDEKESLSAVLCRITENSASSPPDLSRQHQRLRQRLVRAGVDTSPEKSMDASAAFRKGLPVGARDIWLLADEILATARGKAMTLLVDCPGQAATRYEETLVLSEYVAHLALCMRAHGIGGGEIIVHVTGESAGGIYVALAAGADRVDAGPGAIVRVLPAAALRTVLRRTVCDETLEDALKAGVVDRVAPVGSDDSRSQ